MYHLHRSKPAQPRADGIKLTTTQQQQLDEVSH